MDLKKEASKLVNGGQRERDYGHPKTNHERIAKIWSAVFDHEVTPTQVVLCMLGMKLARLVHTPDHSDTHLDIYGYVEVLKRVLDPDDQPVSPENAPSITFTAGHTHPDGSVEGTLDEALADMPNRYVLPIKNGLRLLDNPTLGNIQYAQSLHPGSSVKWNMDGTVDIIFANFFAKEGNPCGQ